MSDEKPKVKHQSKMDAETFLKHINARHVPIGQMTVFGKSAIPGDENEDFLRTYHDKAHELGFESHGTYKRTFDHTHGEAEAG